MATRVEHEPVDVAHEPVALGGGQEPSGRHERAGWFVGETNERLVVGRPPVGDGDDRLVVHGEQVVLEGVAQAREPGPPMQARGRGEVLAEATAVAVGGALGRGCAQDQARSGVTGGCRGAHELRISTRTARPPARRAYMEVCSQKLTQSCTNLLIPTRAIGE